MQIYFASITFIIIFNSAKVNNILHKFTTAFQKGKVQQNSPLFFVSNAKFKDEMQAVIDFSLIGIYNIDNKNIGVKNDIYNLLIVEIEVNYV